MLDCTYLSSVPFKLVNTFLCYVAHSISSILSTRKKNDSFFSLLVVLLKLVFIIFRKKWWIQRILFFPPKKIDKENLYMIVAILSVCISISSLILINFNQDKKKIVSILVALKGLNLIQESKLYTYALKQTCSFVMVLWSSS